MGLARSNYPCGALTAFLFPSLCLHSSVGILWKAGAILSLPFTFYSIISLHQYEFMDSEGAVIQEYYYYYYSFFHSSNCSRFGYWHLFQVGFCLFNMLPTLHFILFFLYYIFSITI